MKSTRITSAIVLAAATTAIVAPAALAAKGVRMPIDGSGRGGGKIVRVHKAAKAPSAYQRSVVAQLH